MRSSRPAPKLAPARIRAFQQTVLDFFRRHRRDLPWRRTRSPWHILVSELMLQQTQVGRVAEKYPRFVRRFPTARALARASLRSVLESWQGLGYNRRAVHLKRAAEAVVAHHGGKVPASTEELDRLPGVGAATAAAVCAFAFNQPVVFIETNIRSVYIHHFFRGARRVHDHQVRPLVEQTLVRRSPRRWYSALMDYGSMLKQSVGNPSRRSAHHTRQGRFRGSDRAVRGAIVRRLVARGRLSVDELRRELAIPAARLHRLLGSLAKERLLRVTGRAVRL